MKNPRFKITREDGFIAIVALGILSLMTVFLVILVATTNTTYKNLKTTKDYYIAQDVANSILESLELEVSEKDFGYNSEQTCTKADFGISPTKAANGGISATTDPKKSICAKLAPSIVSQGVEDIEVTFKIVGRPKESEFFTGTDCPGIPGSKCFVVPFPGTGAAGEKCNLYRENLKFDGTKNALGMWVNDKGQIDTAGTVHQLDYSCNWGKLSLGSSATDRIAVPLYYTEDDGTPDGKTVNPFNKTENPNATQNFILRMRTPCDPSLVKGDDKTICSDSQRYKLNTDDGNDIVVQWQLTGKCLTSSGKEEECGLVQNMKEIKQSLSESKINGDMVDFQNKKVLNNEILAEDLNSSKKPSIKTTLSLVKKPVFALFLNKKLIANDTKKTKIPYLEYQILTDKFIPDAQTKMEVSIKINGTQLNKTIYKTNKKDLIDFAIQN